MEIVIRVNGKTTKLMEGVYTNITMVQNIQVNGLKMHNMVMANNNKWMVHHMRGILFL
jgi:hypothetical protein